MIGKKGLVQVDPGNFPLRLRPSIAGKTRKLTLLLLSHQLQAIGPRSPLPELCGKVFIKEDGGIVRKVGDIVHVLIVGFCGELVAIVTKVLEVPQGDLVSNLGLEIGRAGVPSVKGNRNGTAGDQVGILHHAVIGQLEGAARRQQVPSGKSGFCIDISLDIVKTAILHTIDPLDIDIVPWIRIDIDGPFANILEHRQPQTIF